ncbi:hypothetical protein K440DRAFT_288839 [Wilcoxina mikolae CBS 423.85]|nr:hypothetical protein K440DRAFT_288839 [Wilcoxina mikolae CBS 423.85]
MALLASTGSLVPSVVFVADFSARCSSRVEVASSCFFLSFFSFLEMRVVASVTGSSSLDFLDDLSFFSFFSLAIVAEMGGGSGLRWWCVESGGRWLLDVVSQKFRGIAGVSVWLGAWLSEIL